MFQVNVVRVLCFKSTTESSTTKAEWATLVGNNRSAHRGTMLVLVRSRREITLSSVTSRWMTSSVSTCLLGV